MAIHADAVLLYNEIWYRHVQSMYMANNDYNMVGVVVAMVSSTMPANHA